MHSFKSSRSYVELLPSSQSGSSSGSNPQVGKGQCLPMKGKILSKMQPQGPNLRSQALHTARDPQHNAPQQRDRD